MGLLELCNQSIFTIRTLELLPLTPCEIPRHDFKCEGVEGKMCPESVFQVRVGRVGS